MPMCLSFSSDMEDCVSKSMVVRLKRTGPTAALVQSSLINANGRTFFFICSLLRCDWFFWTGIVHHKK